MALTWKDLNFTTNELHINKAFSLGKDNRLYVKSTKTGIARTMKMDDNTMAVLKEWQQKQKQDYLKIGINTMKPKQLVFNLVMKKMSTYSLQNFGNGLSKSKQSII